uniref:Amidase domain-containing protein n=1 Tax=Timema bartmani TaxID=61472 RepID=A0A7R9HZ33_9NEOP|nr:unnamed protein product [Timema bartmani]
MLEGLSKISAVEVVEGFVERIKQVNPLINAVVCDRFELALKEAVEADELIGSGKLTKKQLQQQKPFLGIPFTTKDSTAAKVSRRNTKATEDADAVVLMKEAGAILLGTTNIPELNMWCETRNNVFGQTLNPYNTTRTVGGSSGGEASIIAANGSPLGLASDIGGSIRMPAFYCGIFGHKPTSGLTPMKGFTRRTGKEEQTMVTAGPMCRYAQDLAPFLKVIIGNNISKLKLDEQTNWDKLLVLMHHEWLSKCYEPRIPLLFPQSNLFHKGFFISILRELVVLPVTLEDVSFYYMESSGDPRASSINQAMQQALFKAVSHFRELSGHPIQKASKYNLVHTNVGKDGARERDRPVRMCDGDRKDAFSLCIGNVTFPEMKYSFRLWRYWMTKEPMVFPEELANREVHCRMSENNTDNSAILSARLCNSDKSRSNGCVSPFQELPKLLVGQSDFTFASLLRLFNDMLPSEKAPWAEKTTKTLLAKIVAKLGDNGVLLYPSHPTSASYHYSSFLRPYNFGYWAVFNVLHLPVTQVPMGLDRDGLPVGIQIPASYTLYSPNDPKKRCLANSLYVKRSRQNKSYGINKI